MPGPLDVILAPSLRRFHPRSPLGESRTPSLDAAPGDSVSFQVVVRTRDGIAEVTVDAESDLPVRVRLVGWVPLARLNTDTPDDEMEGREHLPGLVPDPLLETNFIFSGAHETNSFWVTVTVPREAKAGVHVVRVAVDVKHVGVQRLRVPVRVHPVVLPPRRLRFGQWFHANALHDQYGLENWDEGFWNLLPAYLENQRRHGQDVVLVPLLTPPVDGIKRPTQLLGVEVEGDHPRRSLRFDWSLVSRYLAAARAAGFEHFDWPHLFTQGGCKHPLRVYRGRGEGEQILWADDAPLDDPAARAFFASLLPELRAFCEREGVLATSYFHVSDEPFGEEARANYRTARGLLRELAPWMQVMDALSEIEFVREGLCDLPVPTLDHAPEFEGVDHWVYFCCGPRGRYLNRLVDTPLAKIRMAGVLLYREGALGMLHWGYNSWYHLGTRTLIDPYKVLDGHLWPMVPSGDSFVVYPGPDGPIDSIRWEVFAEALQDYTLLQAAGVDRNSRMLRRVGADYSTFPRDPDFVPRLRRRLFKKLADGQGADPPG